MRHLDPSSLYRNTVGFDRVFSLIDHLTGVESAPGYPPYNIERTAENDYRISIAVAGFAEADLSIEVKEGVLSVRGDKQNKSDAAKEWLHQGIAERSFNRRFHLADGVQVTAANLKNGLLHVDLVREIPEAKKPRTIPIGNGGTTIEAQNAA